MTTWNGLGQQDFVALTTYRASGEGVSTPVWVVPDGEDLLVWTGEQTWKVTRIRRDPRVDLAVCSRRGGVAPDAVHHAGTATVTSDAAALTAVRATLQAKYGLQYRVITTLERVVDLVRRRHTARVVLRISPTG